MTDLEITRLCARAMDISHSWTDTKVYLGTGAWNLETGVCYQPLHDDAQAMELVKKLCIQLTRNFGEWRAGVNIWDHPFSSNADLNRAICECVAKMEKAKEGEVNVQT